MGKVEELRALREARYAANQKGAAPVKGCHSTAVDALAKALAPKPEVTDFCGHQGIGGKRCTRELGHSERNHRYK